MVGVNSKGTCAMTIFRSPVHGKSADQIRALPYGELRAICNGMAGVDRMTRLVAQGELDRREARGRTVPAVA